MLDDFYKHLFDRTYMTGVDRETTRVKATGEVFTPTPLVEEILDKMDQHLFVDPEKTLWGTDFTTTTWHDQYEGIFMAGILFPDTGIDGISGVTITTGGVVSATETIALYHLNEIVGGSN